jgi:hypothetical protein
MLLRGFPPDIVRRLEVLRARDEAITHTPYGPSHITTPITMGCKQGCPLSPIKFCIIINMFYTWLTATSSAGYAPTSPCDAQGDAPPLEAVQGFMDDTTLIITATGRSCLPYSLMAAGTKRGDLEGARSALIEPVRERAGLPKTATAHAMLCGDLSHKGTGITDPLAHWHSTRASNAAPCSTC